MMTSLTQNVYDSLTQLVKTPNLRPYVFRTRLERNMVRLIAYAKETNQHELHEMSKNCLDKMQNIIDKSNTTSDGILRSYSLLRDDLQQILITLSN